MALDPFTMALMGGASLGSSFLGSRASGQASQAQSQAAMLGAVLQAQAQERARQDVLAGRSQAERALLQAQPQTLQALQESAARAEDVRRQGAADAERALVEGREAAIRPLTEAEARQEQVLRGAARGQLGALAGAYGEQRGFQQPYLGAGAGAVNQLAALYGVGGEPTAQGYGSFTRQPTLEELQMDPGYAFRLREGERALQAQQAAGGRQVSGAALKAATRYGQEAGSQEYQNAYARFMQNRQATLAGLQGLASGGQ